MKLRRKIQKKDERVHRFLVKQFRKPSLSWSHIQDPRHQSWVKWRLDHLLNGLFLGMLTGLSALRHVEVLTERLSPAAQRLVPKRVPDTTLSDLVRRLDPMECRLQLVRQVREMNRSNYLKPVDLPCGVLTIDGKNVSTLTHHANGTAQKHTNTNGKPCWLARAMRATLTSSVAKICIDQVVIPPDTNEMGYCKAFVEQLHKTYGHSDLFEILDFDSGYTSKSNAEYVNGLGYGYLMGLKKNQPELLLEAKRVLFKQLDSPEAETPWERRNGTLIRRRLYRTAGMAGYHGWNTLRQVWLVRQETVNDRGELIAIENRFFLSNLLWNYLNPKQILRVVRGHWGVENDTFNSLDLQWKEDFGRWCTTDQAVWVLSFLRLMAYNLLQHLRKRHLIRKTKDGAYGKPLPWFTTFAAMTDALVKTFESPTSKFAVS